MAGTAGHCKPRLDLSLRAFPVHVEAGGAHQTLSGWVAPMPGQSRQALRGWSFRVPVRSWLVQAGKSCRVLSFWSEPRRVRLEQDSSSHCTM